MAIQDSKGFFRGVLGDLVFRVVNGKQVVQHRSKRENISKRTKDSSALFGICSKQVSIIRGKLNPWLGSNHDSKMFMRLQGMCFKILKNQVNRKRISLDLYSADLSSLAGFEFNVNSPVSKYLLAETAVLGEPKTGLDMRIPKLETVYDLNYPRDSENVDLHLIVLHIPKEKVSRFSVFSTYWTLPKKEKHQEELFFQTPPIETEGITLVMVQLLFFDNQSKFGKVYINDKYLHPMQVIYAR